MYNNKYNTEPAKKSKI